MHEPRNDPGPSGLVARAEAGAVVAVKILIKQDEVAPVRILLELSGAAVHRTLAGLVPHEDAGQSARDLLGDLVERHEPAGAGRAFDGEIVSIVCVVLQQSPNDHAR